MNNCARKCMPCVRNGVIMAIAGSPESFADKDAVLA